MAFLVALALYATLPGDSAPIRHAVTLLAVLAGVPLVVLNPLRYSRQEPWSRDLSVGLHGVVAAATLAALGETVAGLVIQGTPRLLVAALQVWVAMVLSFSLLYWQIDRDGPVARLHPELPHRRRPDFRFREQGGATPWSAWYVDYLRTSFRTAVAFMTADATPVSRRAKWLTAVESFAGYVLIGVVIARAVALVV
ncbi:hypothetical protein EDF46_1202 [Frondihabitans sp. PhB188]|uniref:hypothetical protein n=1 Tax=Frondihabitans sp. PhB188 TaxID=2485200 RepID=UPI000F490271|nr:hypothetical protein [Frondihabitans sp. PhB188]ROQ39570.1 hypothetical protein EDF46_1202 [Frondihabitans sp. PhB188]